VRFESCGVPLNDKKDLMALFMHIVHEGAQLMNALIGVPADRIDILPNAVPGPAKLKPATTIEGQAGSISFSSAASSTGRGFTI
jgi:hypothetical protein